MPTINHGGHTLHCESLPRLRLSVDPSRRDLKPIWACAGGNRILGIAPTPYEAWYHWFSISVNEQAMRRQEGK